MLAGLVLMSAAIGLVTVGGALALSVPTWAALMLYPAVCSLSLLSLAAIGNLRTGGTRATALRRQEA